MKKSPNQITLRQELNLKLGIKSSISNLKQLFAASLSLYIANDLKPSLEYTDETVSRSVTSISLKTSLKAAIDSFFTSQLSSASVSSVVPNIESSPLFTSLVEHLQVALGLFWKLAAIEFDGTHTAAEERTGGNRFARILKFSSNIELLRISFTDKTGNIDNDLKNILFNWISNSSVLPEDSHTLEKLITFLTLFSEETQFKIRDSSGSEVIFQQEGIYKVLIEGNTVEERDRLENVGPFRILNSSVKANLHPFLEIGANGFSLKPSKTSQDLKEYTEKVENLLNLNPKKTTVFYESGGEVVEADKVLSIDISFPRNKIIYGAPGTGKSFYLRKKVLEDLKIHNDNVTRIIFHPSYTYQQFVGAYKPTPIYKSLSAGDDSELFASDKIAKLDVQKEPVIDYSLLEGPFLETLIKSILNPEVNYILIIEEINRANVASVFGDVFQLLDRNKDGSSEYEIDFNKDIRTYLKSRGIEGKVSLPSNFFIWATMNSADQGVMPLDAAFKRRWSFEYLPIDAMEHKVADAKILFQKNELSWNKFRKELNEKLKSLQVSEDKLIGPFFLSSSELLDEHAVKNKLLLYLRDDVVRHNPASLFNARTFSDIIFSYDNDSAVFTADLNPANWEISPSLET